SATRLKDGNLAASTLSMDQALRNFLSLGMTPEEASARLSLYPAEFLGLNDRGRIEPGAWADYVILDKNFELLEVVIEGVPVTLTSHNEGEL
ncbi:TPA: amidohydrolase family protein, partial [Escherichia coli]|nr:amidohydrolase family protein [Escherichia coli]HDS0108706.1 amidohydrolase family protein [Escherichia coli]HDS0391585.1 amidohydrolase family protein [Escherichia coli]